MQHCNGRKQLTELCRKTDECIGGCLARHNSIRSDGKINCPKRIGCTGNNNVPNGIECAAEACHLSEISRAKLCHPFAIAVGIELRDESCLRLQRTLKRIKG